MTGTGGCRSPAVQPADVGFVTDSHAQVWLYSPYLCVCVMVGTGGCRSPVVQPAGAGLCHQQSWTVWLYSPMCVWWQVQEGVDHLLYNLLVLGCVTVMDSVTVLTCVCVWWQVQEGVDHLLYNLLVLGCVTDGHGQVWLCSPMDLYLVETVPLLDQKDQQVTVKSLWSNK